MTFNRLSEALWQERRLLELLLFKLEEEQLMLSAGRTRWLSHATREVESVLDEIRSAELARAVEADAAAAALGVSPSAGLTALAEAAPAPWDDLLRGHRDAFASLTAEIARLADDNRELLAMSHRAAQETLATLQHAVDNGPGTYDVTGQTLTEAAGARLVDRAL